MTVAPVKVLSLTRVVVLLPARVKLSEPASMPAKTPAAVAVKTEEEPPLMVPPEPGVALELDRAPTVWLVVPRSRTPAFTLRALPAPKAETNKRLSAPERVRVPPLRLVAPV